MTSISSGPTVQLQYPKARVFARLIATLIDVYIGIGMPIMASMIGIFTSRNAGIGAINVLLLISSFVWAIYYTFTKDAHNEGRSIGKRAIRIGVRESLPSNIALYESLGYQTLKTEPHGADRSRTMLKRLKWAITIFFLTLGLLTLAAYEFSELMIAENRAAQASLRSAQAHALAQRLEIHYTPKHASWLNIAEIELSVLAR